MLGGNWLDKLTNKKKGPHKITCEALSLLARSERFELPTYGFVVRCSIQLSYERKLYRSVCRHEIDQRKAVDRVLKGMCRRIKCKQPPFEYFLISLTDTNLGRRVFRLIGK